jgi:hypothetical protein
VVTGEEWALAATCFFSGLGAGLLGMLCTILRPWLAAMDGRGFRNEALTNGKDIVVDKPGCITHNQLDEIEQAATQSGRFWSVTFSERFEVRCAIKAEQLVREGRIGADRARRADAGTRTPSGGRPSPPRGW